MENQKRSRLFRIIAISAIAVALLVLGYYFLHRTPVNPIVNNGGNQKTELIKANDSITVLRQRLFLSESRAGLIPTGDSVLLQAIKAAKLNPSSIALWQSIYSGTKRTVEMSDSFNNKINDILQSQKSLLLTSTDAEKAILQQKYDSQLSALLNSRIPFSEVSKYRTLKGDIGFNNKLNITADSVISEPFVVFGEKKSFLGLGRPEYSVVIGDKNPNITQTKAYSATLKPKTNLQLGIGPVVLFDNKSLNVGAGLTFKKGFFTFTAGYSLYNKQFKP